ncbi:MAG: alpha/beta hydrolase [Cyanobacteria bacterium J06607_15]
MSILNTVRYDTEKINGLDIFYREAGDPADKAVVLLHGYPTSSHMYRDVLGALGDKFYLIAPDYPGFGNSSFPTTAEYAYTFDNIAATIDEFLVQRDINQYVLAIQDYGAPIGFRIATKNPQKVKGFIVMNANVYEAGLSPTGWAMLYKYWQEKTPEIAQSIAAQMFSNEGLKWMYTHGTRNPDNILPDNWNLDIMKFARQGQHQMQLDLLYDYQNNVKLYPVWQKYLRDYQPPMSIIWGKNDAFFPEAGAAAYKKDLKNLDYSILDTGHFVLEEEGEFAIAKMRSFLASIVY